MRSRRLVLPLVTALAVLTVLLAVLFVFQALFTALGDLITARVLFGIAIGCLVLLVSDLLLLVGALGVIAAEENRDERRDRQDRGEL